ACVGSLGQPAPARVVGTAGPDESDHRRVNGSGRTRSPQATRSAAVDDASGRGPAYGPSLRVDHRNSESISSWQADRQLCGDDTQRELQWRQATAGTHQQARQLLVALLAGGGGASSG